MSEMEREKPDFHEEATDEFEFEMDDRYRIVDMQRVRWRLVFFVIVLVVFASGSSFLEDVFADVVATLILMALLTLAALWLADRLVEGFAPRR